MNVVKHPFGVTIAGTKAYVTNDIDKTVSLIDTSTNTVLGTVNVDVEYPGGVAITQDGTKIYAACGENGIVSVIDAATNKVTTTIKVGSSPWGVAIAGTKVYMTNSGDDTVSVIDMVTNTVTATVNVENVPEGVAATSDGSKVYVANEKSNTLSIIDTSTDTVIDTVNVGIHPVSLGQFISSATVPKVVQSQDNSENEYSPEENLVSDNSHNIINYITNIFKNETNFTNSSSPINYVISLLGDNLVNTGGGNINVGGSSEISESILGHPIISTVIGGIILIFLERKFFSYKYFIILSKLSAFIVFLFF